VKLETGMMIAFVAALLLSIWKLYAFFPKKRLPDDDTTPESVEELNSIMMKCIIDGHDKQGNLTHEELFIFMKKDAKFDEKHFWRFNQNRLNQLLNNHYINNPHHTSLLEIYETLKKS